MDGIRVSDISDLDLERLSIPEHINYLKTEFRSEPFEKVKKILVSRFEKLKLENEEADRKSKERVKHAEELEKELKDCKSRCSELSSLVGKLETKNKELEFLKQRKEEENKDIKRRYSDLEGRVAKLEKETSELVSLESNVSIEAKSNIKENVSRGNRRGHDFGGIDYFCHSPVKRSASGQVEGLLCKPFADLKEEKGSSSLKLGIGRSASEDVIEIIDSENESEDTSKENLLNNIVMRTCSNQKVEENRSSCREKYSSASSLKVEENRSSCEEKYPSQSSQKVKETRSSCGEKYSSVSTLKRKRKLKVVSSDSEDDDGRVNGSDGLDKKANFTDPGEAKDDFTKLISGIRRWKANELKWQYEVDMLFSFKADPILCMKAVCALYRQHTFKEKAMGGSLHSTNRGFKKIDEQRGIALAKFLLDGGHNGELKKSVKELESYDPTGLEECKRLAKFYSDQLFPIYENKEDPFFP